MARDNDDESRPKRSWREIDKMRDGKRSGSSREDAQKERLTRSPVYEQYKTQVSKMFGGGAELPEMLREKLDPTGSIRAREDALRKLKNAEDRKAWAEAATEYVQTHELPDDAYLLDQLLDHPKDRVVEKALAKLEQLIESGALPPAKAPKSLEQRLRSLELTSLDSETQSRAKALRERLRA